MRHTSLFLQSFSSTFYARVLWDSNSLKKCYFARIFHAILPQLHDKGNDRNKPLSGRISSCSSSTAGWSLPSCREGDEERPSALCLQKCHKKLKSWERNFWIPELHIEYHVTKLLLDKTGKHRGLCLEVVWIMTDDVLYVFSPPVRITTSSNNEKGRKELLEHQRTAIPALYLNQPPKKTLLYAVQLG